MMFPAHAYIRFHASSMNAAIAAGRNAGVAIWTLPVSFTTGCY